MPALATTTLHEIPMASIDTELAPEQGEATPSSEIVIGDVEQYDGRVVLYVIKGTRR
jgi:hypothetical protein